jgi:glutamate/tyrosine decarboxylase-like PLP-dependent enzyme
VHEFTDEVDSLAQEILDYSLERLRLDPPLDHPRSFTELTELVGQTITPEGLGGHETLRIFKEVLARSCISTDHPRNLAFIPAAPSEYASLFDLVVAASSLYGGSWTEGAGAVYAENQALRWIADLAEFPPSAGGTFVQGGTIGNLSALVAARYWARKEIPGNYRWTIACSEEAHSSIAAAADVMDISILAIPTDSAGRLIGATARKAIEEFEERNRDHRVFAIIGTAGTTNLGIVDDLEGLANCATELDIWFHVDGAYGLAALASPPTKPLFKGILEADSLIVDPHKWFFAPFDACALIYRDARIGKAAHTQRAPYLDPLEDDGLLNPSDYAIQLTRRPRGLPFWFSLAANGSLKYQEAIEHSLTLARECAEIIKSRTDLELVCEPTLSIVAFKKRGWLHDDYVRWSDELLTKQIGFVTPSAHHHETIIRFAIVNPWTRRSDIEMILATLK